MRFSPVVPRVVTAICLLPLCGCPAALPPSDSEKFKDAAGDGFLDVVPPDGVAFDENTNVSVRFVNAIDDADVVQVARSQGVPEDLIQLLPLVSLVATTDFTLHYADGKTGTFTETAIIEPFEKRFEFACPQRVDVSVRADMFLPLGGAQPLLDDTPLTFFQGTDYACGDTIAFEAFVDAEGRARVEEIDGTAFAGTGL